MSDFEIILIDSNQFNIDTIVETKKSNFEKDEKNVFNLKRNYVDINQTEDLLKKFCRTVKVNNTNFMEEVVKYIGLDDTHYGDVKDCYECKDFTLQIMYIMPHNEDDLDRLKYNMLGSSLTFDKELVYGNVVLFKTYISIDKPLEDRMIDTKFTDLISLIMNNKYHTGVYISSQNKFEQIFFNNNYEVVDQFNNWKKSSDIPSLMKDEKYGVKYHEYLKFYLQFVYNSESEDELNEPFCRLLHGIIKGDGIIYSPFSENSFYELLVEDVFDLLKVWNQLSPQIDDTSKIENKEKTKYQILNNRIKNI